MKGYNDKLMYVYTHRETDTHAVCTNTDTHGVCMRACV